MIRPSFYLIACIRQGNFMRPVYGSCLTPIYSMRVPYWAEQLKAEP